MLEFAVHSSRVSWEKFRRIYPGKLGNPPIVTLNKRLKTTAGWCYHELRKIELSTELLHYHPEEFDKVIIPHELAHQVDWDVFGNEGHGPTWKSIMVAFGLPPNRCHTLVNPLHEARKAARMLK